MASYLNILDHVSKWEGGLVFHQTENQWTNRGIQWTTFQKLAPSLIGIVSPTVQNLKDLTQKQWEKFVEYFWNKATYNNTIRDQEAAHLTFYAKWASDSYGIKAVQRAVGAIADGIIGPNTVAKINADPKAADKIRLALDNRFRRLAANDPSKYAQFLNGWLNRLRDIKKGMFTIGLIGLLSIGVGIYLLSTVQ